MDPSRTAPVTRARLQVLAAAVLFSTGAAAIKSVAFSAWQVACFRCGVAAAALLVFFPAARKGWNRRTLLVGAAYAATLNLFVHASKRTTAANAIFLQATSPLYVLLASRWLLKERVRGFDLVVLALIGVGMGLFFLADQAVSRTAPDPATGNFLAAAAGLTWAATVSGLRWLERSSQTAGPGLATVAAGNLLGCLLCLPLSFPVGEATSADWLTILYLGVFQVALSYVFLTRGVRGVPALEASLLLLAEPALGPIWAWLLHGEAPARLAIAGGAVILAATLTRTLKRP